MYLHDLPTTKEHAKLYKLFRSFILNQIFTIIFLIHGESTGRLPEKRRCLINPSNKKIFAASRLYIPNSWQMQQGGIHDCEDPKNAAIRELREETGITSAEIVAEVPHWFTYDYPPDVRQKFNRKWGTDWKVQTQKWFLLKFTGKDEEINLLGDGTEKPEFGKWAWMSANQVVDLVVEFKKPVYKEVVAVFTPYLQ